MKDITNQYYENQIGKVIEFVSANLSSRITLQKLSDISCLSQFHFHRIFSAYTGESPFEFLQRKRLERTSEILLSQNLNLDEIAMEVGYDNASSLSKAFKKYFGLAPGEFKLSPANQRSIKQINMIEAMKFKVKDIKPKQIIYIRSVGPYGGTGMGQIWSQLIEFIKKHRLWSFGMSFYGISYDDPGLTDPEQCRYDACVSVKKQIAVEGGIKYGTIGGGKYAIFKYIGPYSNLGLVYNWIFKVWIPASGYSLRDAPPFEEYINNPEKTASEKLKTAIYIPIQ
jgi:AraC family transcriptional regulator